MNRDHLVIGTITSFYMALLLDGQFTWSIGGLNVTLSDIVLCLGILIWLLADRVRLSESMIVVVAMSSVLAFWIGCQIFRSPAPVKGLTLYLLHIRDLAVLIYAAGCARLVVSSKRFNRTIFWLGVANAVVCLVLYVMALTKYQSILVSSSLWHPKVIYELDETAMLRLSGFVGDSNFYSILMLPPLLCGIGEYRCCHDRKLLLGIAAIAITLAAALSRTFLIAVLLAAACAAAIGARPRRSPSLGRLVFGGAILAALSLVPIPYLNISAYRALVARFARSSTTPRWELARAALAIGLGNPVIGAGIRTIEVILQRPSHNSYIDLFVETGLVGLTIWLTLTAYITIAAFRKRRVEATQPWLYAWLALIPFMAGFSMVQNPLYWLLAGLLAGQPNSSSVPV